MSKSRGFWASLTSPIVTTGTALQAAELHAQRLVISAGISLAEDKIKAVSAIAKLKAEASSITAADYKEAQDFLDQIINN